VGRDVRGEGREESLVWRRRGWRHRTQSEEEANLYLLILLILPVTSQY